MHFNECLQLVFEWRPHEKFPQATIFNLHFMCFSVAVFIQKHDVTPVTSSQKADLQSVQELGAQAVGMATLVLIHGRYTVQPHYNMPHYNADFNIT